MRKLLFFIYANLFTTILLLYVFIEFKNDFQILLASVGIFYFVKLLRYFRLKNRIRKESLLVIRRIESMFNFLYTIPVLFSILLLFPFFPDYIPVRSFSSKDWLVLFIPATLHLIVGTIVANTERSYIFTKKGIIIGVRPRVTRRWVNYKKYELDEDKMKLILFKHNDRKQTYRLDKKKFADKKKELIAVLDKHIFE